MHVVDSLCINCCSLQFSVHLQTFTFSTSMFRQPSRMRTSTDDKQVELLLGQVESAIRDLSDFRSRMQDEFRHLFSRLHGIHTESLKICRIISKHKAVWRQQRETVIDLNTLESLGISVKWDIEHFRELVWRASDVMDSGLLQSVMNDQNMQRTLRDTWETVVKDFKLDWKEKDGDLQDQDQPSISTDGDGENGWDSPPRESMDAEQDN